MNTQDKFYELLNNYPFARPYWDQEKREVDLEALNARSWSTHEQAVINALVEIWTGNTSNGFSASITELAQISDGLRKPILEWLADPYWP